MANDDRKRIKRAILKGIEFARLDREVKRKARESSASTFDRDPEKMVDDAILREMRRDRKIRERLQEREARRTVAPAHQVETSAMDADELRARLLQYPNIDETNVDTLIDTYEERDYRKNELRQRGYGNAMAEDHLDRQGYLRPPGWHSVFFYPGSFRPRNVMLFWMTVTIGAAWLFIYLK